MNSVKTWPDKPYPLGASHDGEGTNFSLFSEVSGWVELCLFDEHGHQTAVELMPVHQFIHYADLIEKRLRNYWGYSTIGCFTPHNESAAGDESGRQVTEFKEFKQMVKALHTAGIEVILDVVYNHTSEGNHLGPMLAFKGIDNAAYYRLMADDPRHYMDYTGTADGFIGEGKRRLEAGTKLAIGAKSIKVYRRFEQAAA
jgi:pullulanase/glycogen debranching enzyme